MAILVRDTMTGPNWDDINERSGELNATWAYASSYTGTPRRWYIINNRAHCGVPGVAYLTSLPPTANYRVSVKYQLFSNVPSLRLGPVVRLSSDQYYTAYYQDGELVLAKRVGGVDTTLDTYSVALTYGSGTTPTTYTIDIEANSTAIGVYLDGVLRCSATDSDVSANGFAGLRATANNDAYTGHHIDEITVSDDTSLVLARSQVIGVIGL